MRFLIIFYAMGAIPPIVFYGSWLFGGPDSTFLSSVIDAFAFIRPWVPVLDTYSEYLIGWGQHQIIPLITAVYSYDFLFLLIAPWCVALGSVSLSDKRNKIIGFYEGKYEERRWALVRKMLPMSFFGFWFFSTGYFMAMLDQPNFDRDIVRSYLMEAPILVLLDYAMVIGLSMLMAVCIVFFAYFIKLLFED